LILFFYAVKQKQIIA